MDNKFKYIAEVTIKSAKNLQKLGLSTLPNPYMYMSSNKVSHK